MDSLVFLDFDGVICDSAQECLVSSWRAYFGSLPEPQPSAVPVGLKAAFLNLRPYVRGGEDFVVCQEILHRNLSVGSQDDFDRLLAARSPQTLARLRECFYEARTALLERQREYWVSLHHLYPHAAQPLTRWAASPGFHILSTKRPRFIAEILAASNIAFPRERILYADKSDKGSRILEVLHRRKAGAALLVDDQIDHLVAIRDLGGPIDLRLAAWGYVKPEWLSGAVVPVIGPNELSPLVDAALGRS